MSKMPKVQELRSKKTVELKDKTKKEVVTVTYTVTIPKTIVETLDIEKGDAVEFKITSGEIRDGKILDPKIEFKKVKKKDKED